MNAWRAASSAVLDLVFPRRCVQCGTRGEWICGTCEAEVHHLAPPLCELCGREIGAGNRCQSCARDQPRIDGIRAAIRYERAVREAIHRLKYGGQRGLAAHLATYLEEAATSFRGDVDILVPVPLHPGRLRERGYNQSELLARHLGWRLQLPVASLVTRMVDTRDQVHLKRGDRQENVRRAFACPQPGAVRGHAVLLVDDVCTTGSTLLACAAPLFRARAASVRAVVIARQDTGRE